MNHKVVEPEALADSNARNRLAPQAQFNRFESFATLGIFGIFIPLLGIVVGTLLIRSIQRRSVAFVATVLTALPVLIGGIGTLMGHHSVAASATLPADVIAAGYTISWQTTYLGAAVSSCLMVLAIVAFVTHSATKRDTDTLV